MATMNPVLRLKRAFRSIGADEEQAEEAASAIDDHSYGRRESDLKFQTMMAELRRDMAEARTQMLLAIFIATGLIIGAIGVAVALLD